CSGENNAMNPTRKKASLITRFRYSAPIYRGKENATVQTARIEKLGGKAALLCQRVEDNAFHLRMGGSAFRRRWQGNRRRRKIIIRESWTFRAKENSAERLARPG